MIDRLKEKKTNVIDALKGALDALFKSVRVFLILIFRPLVYKMYWKTSFRQWEIRTRRFETKRSSGSFDLYCNPEKVPVKPKSRQWLNHWSR